MPQQSILAEGTGVLVLAMVKTLSLKTFAQYCTVIIITGSFCFRLFCTISSTCYKFILECPGEMDATWKCGARTNVYVGGKQIFCLNQDGTKKAAVTKCNSCNSWTQWGLSEICSLKVCVVFKAIRFSMNSHSQKINKNALGSILNYR